MLDLHKIRYTAISVIGPHAGELEDKIFRRKISDIEVVGRTFWLIRSHRSKPDMVQAICNHARSEGYSVPCIFIEPYSNAGSTPTKTSDSAIMFSADRASWSKFPELLSPVTGKIDSTAYALVFDALKPEHGVLDLWGYADFFNPERPLRIMQGASTLCALQKDMTGFDDSEKIKSRFRRIVAIGNLCEPYAVWLK